MVEHEMRHEPSSVGKPVIRLSLQSEVQGEPDKGDDADTKSALGFA